MLLEPSSACFVSDTSSRSTLGLCIALVRTGAHRWEWERKGHGVHNGANALFFANDVSYDTQFTDFTVGQTLDLSGNCKGIVVTGDTKEVQTEAFEDSSFGKVRRTKDSSVDAHGNVSKWMLGVVKRRRAAALPERAALTCWRELAGTVERAARVPFVAVIGRGNLNNALVVLRWAVINWGAVGLLK